MTYMLVEATNPSDLEERVQRLQEQGWEPQGGVTIVGTAWSSDGTGEMNVQRWRYVQAMQAVGCYALHYTMDSDGLAALRESYRTTMMGDDDDYL